MKLEEIIRIADKVYSDGLVLEYFKTRKPVGDTLAEFIVHELEETYEGGVSTEQQLEEANRVLTNGRDQLDSVAHEFLLQELRSGHKRKRKKVTRG